MTEPPDNAGVKVPPPLYFVAGLLAGVGLEEAVATGAPPTPLRVCAAVAFTGAFAALAGSAVGRFRRAGTSVLPILPSTALVANGAYRFTRNPMYVGMACLYVAISFAIGTLWPLALLPVVLLGIDRLVIAREEAYLEREFGASYNDYRARVRRWL